MIAQLLNVSPVQEITRMMYKALIDTQSTYRRLQDKECRPPSQIVHRPLVSRYQTCCTTWPLGSSLYS